VLQAISLRSATVLKSGSICRNLRQNGGSAGHYWNREPGDAGRVRVVVRASAESHADRSVTRAEAGVSSHSFTRKSRNSASIGASEPWDQYRGRSEQRNKIRQVWIFARLSVVRVHSQEK
jgi:hypothetical protein